MNFNGKGTATPARAATSPADVQVKFAYTAASVASRPDTFDNRPAVGGQMQCTLPAVPCPAGDGINTTNKRTANGLRKNATLTTRRVVTRRVDPPIK